MCQVTLETRGFLDCIEKRRSETDPNRAVGKTVF
jgi:hypothetical protein